MDQIEGSHASSDDNPGIWNRYQFLAVAVSTLRQNEIIESVESGMAALNVPIAGVPIKTLSVQTNWFRRPASG